MEGYIKGFTFLPFGRYFLNTTETAVLSTIGAVLSASLAGFAFARLHSPTKQFLFPLVLSTMMLPATVLLIPQYVLFSQLHWVNTYLPLIVPSYLGGSAFLIRQFFAGIPEEVFEAARIDGCGYLGMYWSIARPLGIPAFIAAMVFHFQFSWNDFINPLIYLNSNTKDTVALGLVNFRSAYGATPWNQLMAVSLVFALIPLVLFFLVQRQLVSGMDRGDVSIVLRVEAANAAYGHYPAPRVIGAGAHYAVAVILRC
ncbi:MAG: carbohydrate ABC transporter permease [Chloroflexi bacterium]|nr:carbohydrate ABC transporter permease [Chloroflexota bacterium]